MNGDVNKKKTREGRGASRESDAKIVAAPSVR